MTKMDKLSKFSFYCDDKYEEVITALTRSGWSRVSQDQISESTLIWRNLKEIDFDHLSENTVVNHLQGSQHFSNKSYLAYHLASTGRLHHCPQTWSPSFRTVSDLCFMLLQSELLYSLSNCSSNERTLRTLCSEQLQMLQMLNDSGYISDISSLNRYKFTLESIRTMESSVFNLNSILSMLEAEGLSHENKELNTWIVKPIGLSCGEQIVLSRGVHGTLEVADSFGFKCIVQQYLERPLLVRQSRKFDIRQWVLIQSLEPLTIYGFSECYLRLTSKPFSLEAEFLKDPLMHLSNHAIQKTNDQIGLTSSEYLCETMMSQSEFDQELSERHTDGGVFPNIILPQIRQISIDVVNSVRDRLSTVGRGFEWLGLDLMVTDDMKVRLLEVNTSPDITHSTPVTSRLVKYAVSDLMDVLFQAERLTGVSCPHCQKSEITPHWCLWHYDDSPFSGLQATALKRKKHKFQGNSIPPDLEIYRKIINITGNSLKKEEDQEEDEEEI